MPSNIRGIGVIGFRDAGYFVPMLASAFSATEELQSEDATGYPLDDCGILQTTDTVVRQSTVTVTVGAQSIDDMEMASLLFGQKWQDAATITVPKITSATVPSATPYEITVDGLTVNSPIDVTIIRDIAPGKEPMKKVTAAPAAADEFQVTAGKVTFAAAAAGLKIMVYTRSELTDKKVIGGATPYERFENVELFGKICTTRSAPKNIWFPRCTSNTGLTFDPTSDAFTREFRALIPTDLGFARPFILW